MNEPADFNCGDLIQDIDGNIYETISINNRCWMKENLKTTKYNNGVSIPNLTNQQDWVNTNSGAYACYNNISANCDNYGALYNFYAVETGNLCPVGWKVPSDSEFTSLINSISGDQNYQPFNSEDDVGGSWSTGGYNIKNNSAWNDRSTNISGFNVLPAGHRSGIDTYGDYSGEGTFSNIWTSTKKAYYPDPAIVSFIMKLEKDSDLVTRTAFGYRGSPSPGDFNAGNSVRCIQEQK